MILFPTPVDQFLPYLLCSFVLGIFLGAVYEIFRLRRIAFKGKARAGFFTDTVLIALEDTLFLVFTAAVMTLIAYKLNYGLSRWYSFAAAVLGVILWRKTAGRLVTSIGDKIILILKRAFSFVFGKIFLFPIRHISRLIRKQIHKIENNRARAYTKRYQKNILDMIFKE